MREYVGSICDVLLHLVDERNGKVVMERQPEEN
jgi:hypothetical protein